ncbi:MAG: hypothetical protein ACRDZO_28650 [Egibacteraceae bacterium]
MSRRVTLVAAGALSASAVGSRIAAFASGLTARGWIVDVCDISPVPLSRMWGLIGRLFPRPAPGLSSWLRGTLEAAGFEGDVMPATGWRARIAVRRIQSGPVVVSVPPFAFLWVAACGFPAEFPLVVDYRDPWAARDTPPPLAQATAPLERLAVRRAAAVTYAGGPRFGELLVQRLGLAPSQVVSVPNGHDPADLARLPPYRAPGRNGSPLHLVFAGYWYGRNGPGILPGALARVGPSVAALTVIGGVSPSLQQHFGHGSMSIRHGAVPRKDLYQRLAQADAAVVTVDPASATESRIPAKVYDYLAVGIPVIAICPPDATLLRVPEAGRFHHLDTRDTEGLIAILRRAAADRTLLRPGPPGAGPTRDEGVAALHALLLTLQ